MKSNRKLTGNRFLPKYLLKTWTSNSSIPPACYLWFVRHKTHFGSFVLSWSVTVNLNQHTSEEIIMMDKVELI